MTSAFTLLAGALIILSGLHMALKPSFRRRAGGPSPSPALVRIWGFVAIAAGATALISSISQIVSE